MGFRKNQQIRRAFEEAAKTLFADGKANLVHLQADRDKIPREQRALVDIYLKFRNTEAPQGGPITGEDINRAVEAAKKHLAEKYALDTNKASKDEVAAMSMTGQRFADLAKAMKAALPRPGRR